MSPRYLRPLAQAFAAGRDAAGLVERVAACAPVLVVLEATGGFEVTVAARLAAAGLRGRPVHRHEPVTAIWMGDNISLESAMASGVLEAHGPADQLRRLSAWLGLSAFAPIMSNRAAPAVA